mgnify:CR=1 FL=1
MKNTTKLILGGLLLSGIGVGSLLTNNFNAEEIPTYIPRENSLKTIKSSGLMAIELYEESRKNVNTGKMEPEDFSNAWQAVKLATANASRSSVLTLKDEGPDNVGGRTRAILVDNSNINTIYAGSVSGGLFKSTNRGNTWTRVNAFNTVLSISCIAQTPNGTIYVGTGSTFERNVSDKRSGGHRADGVYYTTDGGTTFQKLTPTPSWGINAVNAIVADPNQQDVIYIGGNGGGTTGIGLTKVENKTNFTKIPEISLSVSDVKISKDGNLIVVGTGSNTFVKEGSGVFTRVSGTGAGQIKALSGRIVYAISPDKNSNGKYSVYASMAKSTGMLGGVSASHDNGQTWVEVIPETPNGSAPTSVLNTDPFANGLSFQGLYNNTITVIPGFPKKFIIGGIDLHEWAESATAPPFGQMSRISSWSANPTSRIYVHADNHTTVWDNTDRLYIGNDGGVGISDNATTNNITYYPANRGYNVTQFYGISYSKYGDLLGGAQDNGTQYKDARNPGTSALEFREVGGGDGFDCEISHLDENVLFSTVYTGATFRTSTKSATRSTFTGTEIDALSDNVKPFYNEIRLYENGNDLNSTDSVWWFATEDKPAGSTVMVTSKNLDLQFPYVLPVAVNVTIDTSIDALGDTTFSYLHRDTLRIQDRVQSLFAQGLSGSGGIWVTRSALRFGETPVWFKVINSVSGRVSEMEFSKDGDILYAGTTSGAVIRIKGFNGLYYNNEAHDTINGVNAHDRAAYNYADIRSGTSQLQIQTIYNGSQMITGIGVDPNDSEHVVITLGGYSAATNIRRSTTAASTTGTSSFSSIKGNMPAMPVFDAVIDMSDPTRIIAGTEFGAWVSLNSGGSWTAQNDEMGGVPVYDVRQQWRPWATSEEDLVGCYNPGVIYFGTFGRGIWSSSTFLSIDENIDKKEIPVTSINLYPNPVNNFTNIEFDLTNSADVKISVFSLTGQLISSQNLSNRQPGELKHRINTSQLTKGIYFVTVEAEGMKFKGSKFIKQ